MKHIKIKIKIKIFGQFINHVTLLISITIKICRSDRSHTFVLLLYFRFSEFGLAPCLTLHLLAKGQG